MNFKTALKVVIAMAGAYLCVHLILSIGLQEILNTFVRHAAALVFLTCIYLSYHLLRTRALKICIPYPTEFKSLFGIRLAGEAIAYLAVGSVVGDALKVALGRKKIPVVEGATGVFAEKLIYHLAGAGFIIGGLLIAVLRYGADKLLLYSIGGMAFLFIGLLFLLSSGKRPIAWILKGIRVRRPKLRETVLKTEESLFQFSKDHPKEFLYTFLLDLLSYFYSVVEVLFILYLLGIRASFGDIWYFQAVVKTMNTATLIVPANLGVFEATNVFLAEQLQMGGQAGMILALFVRIRATLWSLAGYLWFLCLLRK